jgi:aspartate aminotransferase
VQTISGTGANHLGAVFAQRFLSSSRKVYIGTPTWGNYKPLFEHSGFEVLSYTHYDEVNKRVDFDAILRAAHDAPRTSIFVLQACCHNPTGMDFSRAQWIELAQVLRNGGHFPFLGMMICYLKISSLMS